MHPFQVIMLLCAVFMLHAADLEKPEVQLSFNAQRALDGYTRDTEKLQDSFDKDKAKLTDNVVKALEKELDATTKKGDLTGALAIKAKIDELNPGLVFVESKPKVAVALIEAVEGKWFVTMDRGYTSPWVFTSKGRTIVSKDNRGTYSSKGDTILINWVNGLSESFTVNAEVTAGTGTDFGGLPLRVVRQ